MRTVSDAYLVAINEDTEQTTFFAEFGFVPPGAREGMIIEHSKFELLGRISQLNNRIYEMGGKWSSIELNRTVLDGEYEYIDKSSDAQTGEWSTNQSDENNVFQDKPYIEMILDKPYDIIGTQIIFDDKGEEWATEIKVSYYNSIHALIKESIFENNTANFLINYQENDVQYIKITINKWNMPFRFAKVCQIIPGQIRHFKDHNIYSFILKEKITPFGALTIPEYTIVFPNENQEFNIINPDGAISKLRELMEIPSWIGLITPAKIEYVDTGNFLLYAWPDSANDESAAFICRPDLAFANDGFMQTGNRIQTVMQAADLISSQSRLKTPITVDSSLQNIQVNTKIDLDDKTPLQNALGQLAIAAGGIVKFERDGTYTLKSLEYGQPVRAITYGDMWKKPDIKQEQMVSGITVKYVTYVSPSAAFGRSEALNSASEFISAESETGLNIEISSNFILNAAEARRVGGIMLEYFNHRLNYTIDYRGDMSIEAGDVVSIETDYGFANVLILEHEISYDNQNFLQGKIRGIGI